MSIAVAHGRRTLAEELRLFGVHEQLKDRLDHYLTSLTVDDL